MESVFLSFSSHFVAVGQISSHFTQACLCRIECQSRERLTQLQGALVLLLQNKPE